LFYTILRRSHSTILIYSGPSLPGIQRHWADRQTDSRQPFSRAPHGVRRSSKNKHCFVALFRIQGDNARPGMAETMQPARRRCCLRRRGTRMTRMLTSHHNSQAPCHPKFPTFSNLPSSNLPQGPSFGTILVLVTRFSLVHHDMLFAFSTFACTASVREFRA
jgi:hypothetical protein